MKNKILAVKKFHETFKIGYLNSPEADLGIEKNTLRHKLMKEEKEIDKGIYVSGRDWVIKWLFKILWNQTESETIDFVNNENSDVLDFETKGHLIGVSKYLDKVKLKNPTLEFEDIEPDNRRIFFDNILKRIYFCKIAL